MPLHLSASRPTAATLFFSTLLCTGAVLAGQTKLAWDPVSDPRVAGYTIHYGAANAALSNAVNVGTTVSYTVTNLPDGSTNAFAVTTYDAAGTQSAFSNVVVATATYSAPGVAAVSAVASPSGTSILPGSGTIVDDRGDVFSLGGPLTWWWGTGVVRNGSAAWNWAGNECLWLEHRFYCIAGTDWWLQDRDTGAGYRVADPLDQPSPDGTVIAPNGGSVIDGVGNVYTLYGNPNEWGGTAVYRNGLPAWNWAGFECLWWHGALYCHSPGTWWRQDPDTGGGTPGPDPRG